MKAQKELRRIKRNKSKYDIVLTNFFCKGCHMVDFKDFEKYKVNKALIILDEITLDADNRHFKSFKDSVRDFFILHRHLNVDIIYATQSYEMVDLKIRQLTQELWYTSKSVVPFLSKFTIARRIFRNVNINEYTSELTLGYRFCNFLEMIFVSNLQICFRPLYYKYFDSFDESVLSSRPKLHSVTWDTAKLNSKSLSALHLSSKCNTIEDSSDEIDVNNITGQRPVMIKQIKRANN